MPALEEDCEIPITDTALVVPVANAEVVRLRTMLPVMVATPRELAIPAMILLVLAVVGAYEVLRLATVLFVIEIVALLLLLMPTNVCAVELVEAVVA